MQNVTDETKPSVSLRPQDLTGNINGLGVDTAGFSSLAAHLETGAVSGTSPTLDVKLQDSADNSSFADVAGATFTQVITADDSQELALENLNTEIRRFVRLVATVGGGTPSFITSGVIVLGRATNQPA